jgi:hypothetical protein
MAEEPETGGGGFSLSGLMDRKVFGIPLPVVGAGVLGVAILAYRMFGAGRIGNNANGGPGPGNQFSSTSTYTDPTTGLSTSYTATGNGYLPGQLTYQAGPMPYQQGDVYVNYPAQTNTPTPPPDQYPDQFNAEGRDIGQYRYGADEISYLFANIGKYGLTQDVVNDVQKAYMQMVAKVGKQQADLYHYSYIGPGNVQAIPRGETNTTQTVTGLPGNPGNYDNPPYFGAPYNSGQTYPGTNMPIVTATPGTPGQYGNYPPGTLRPGG